VKFFFDNGIAPPYVDALKILAEIQGYQLTHLRERFRPDTKDPDWIAELAAEREWVIISCDLRISRGKVEREAWHESGMTALFFGDTWANQQYWKQAESLVHWWPTIVLRARTAAPGDGFLVPLQGKDLKQIYSAAERP
jgi:hypothetical protein